MSFNSVKSTKQNAGASCAAEWRNGQTDFAKEKSDMTNLAFIAAIGVICLAAAVMWAMVFFKSRSPDPAGFRENVIQVAKQEPVPEQKTVKPTLLGQINAEIAKYEEAEAMLYRCGKNASTLRPLASTLRPLYVNNNNSNYKQLLAMRQKGTARSATVDYAGNISNELSKINSQSDAMKFVVTGGARRHMDNSLGLMSQLNSMTEDMEKSKKLTKERRAKSQDKNYCARLVVDIQSGRYNIKIPK